MFAAIFLPQFRLQAALRFREDLWSQPIAVIDEQTDKGLVLDATPSALALGVAPGLTSPQALARCPELRLLPRAIAQEKCTSAVLLEIAGTLSPDIEATAAGICLADVSRARRPEVPHRATPRAEEEAETSLQSSTAAAAAASASGIDWHHEARRIIGRLAALELRARIGIAANPDLAVLAARRAEPVLVVQNAATFLADLAIAEVDPPPELLAVLRDWGISHLGELAQVPKDALIDRLGPAAGELWQRAMGGRPRLLRLVRPAEEFVETFDFERAIDTAEPLLFILRRMLESLAQRLAGAYRVASKITLTLPLEAGSEASAAGREREEKPPAAFPASPHSDSAADRARYERDFTIPAPTLDVEVLFRILHTHLEGLTLTQCPTGVRLAIEPVRADHRQFQFFESALRDPNRFGETLARLTALVGHSRVGVPELEDTHRPDRYRVVEPHFQNPRAGGEAPARELALGLPLRRYRPPFSAQVQCVRHIPVFIFSEKIHGEIVDAAGPYRRSGHWWDTDCWSREEWDIEMPDGALFHLARQGDSWSIEGSYDVEVVA